MSTYKNAAALRRALEVRLKQQADSTGTDLSRLRRRVVFERLAVRLTEAAAGEWVLKGGAALEFRLLDRARSTKDIDLAVRLDDPDGDELRDVLVETSRLTPTGMGSLSGSHRPSRSPRTPLAVGRGGTRSRHDWRASPSRRFGWTPRHAARS